MNDLRSLQQQPFLHTVKVPLAVPKRGTDYTSAGEFQKDTLVFDWVA